MSKRQAKRTGRQERLAAALRENLRRRKAQARGRAETKDGHGASGHKASGPEAPGPRRRLTDEREP